MNARYLLDCRCGRQTPVEAGDAGGRVHCACGNKLDIPTLRQLRKLPVEEVSAAPDGPLWTNRQRLFFVGALLVLAGIAIGGTRSWVGPAPVEAPAFSRPPDPAPQIETIRANAREAAARYREEAKGFDIARLGRELAELANADLRSEARRFDEAVADLRRAQANYDQAIEERERAARQHEIWTWLAWGLAGIGIAIIAVTHIASAVPARKR